MTPAQTHTKTLTNTWLLVVSGGTEGRERLEPLIVNETVMFLCVCVKDHGVYHVRL